MARVLTSPGHRVHVTHRRQKPTGPWPSLAPTGELGSCGYFTGTVTHGDIYACSASRTSSPPIRNG